MLSEPHEQPVESTSDCPSIESLSDWVLGQTSPPANRTISEHVRECSRCTIEAGAARRFHDSSIGPPVDSKDLDHVVAIARKRVTPSQKKPGGISRREMALTAFIGIAAMVGILIWGPSGEKQITIPSLENSIHRGVEIELSSPLGECYQAPREFRWTPTQDASRYRILVFNGLRKKIHTDTTDSPFYSLPEGVIHPGSKRIHWRIEALNNQGKTIASSRQASVEIAK